MLARQALAGAVQLGRGDDDRRVAGIAGGVAQPDGAVGSVEQGRDVEHLDDHDTAPVDQVAEVGEQARLFGGRGQVEQGVEGDEGRAERGPVPGSTSEGKGSHVGQDRLHRPTGPAEPAGRATGQHLG